MKERRDVMYRKSTMRVLPVYSPDILQLMQLSSVSYKKAQRREEKVQSKAQAHHGNELITIRHHLHSCRSLFTAESGCVDVQ